MRGNRVLLCAAAALLAFGVAAVIPAASSATTVAFTRNPYLTDATATSVRVNWATASGGTAKVVTWGQAGGTCSQYSATGTGSAFSVGSTAETMWTARLGNLSPHTSYCYQILDGGTPVLTAPITFSTSPAPGDTSPFSFDVIGDTGYNGNSGSNPDQDRLYAQMATSGASFTLTAGDLAYPDGSQTNYGDLLSTGPNVSAIFGPNGWPVFGGSASAFPVLGNHGRSATFLQNWPTPDGVSTSGGVYSMVNYPGQAGANTASYPTAYYAFSVAQARFYVLDADWTDDNVGTSTLYGQDYLNHWTQGSAEYQWLKADLAAHPGGLKFAAFHFPLHSDNATEASDTALQGANSLEGLLASAGVDVVFNGHAHMYQRNAPAPGAMVSYVTGGGGGVLEPTGGLGCSAGDLYSIGWSPTDNVGSRCGTAPVPTSPSQVYHFLHVTVSGSSVTVAPQNALGQSFDVVTYQFPSTPAPVTTTLTPTADTFVYQGTPTASYGSTTPLLASASAYRSLLRFDTSAIDPSANVTGVALRVYSTVALPSGGVQVRPEGDMWDEATTTWSNQPAWSPNVLATSGTPAAAGWLSIPLPTTSISAGGNSDFGLSYNLAQMIERLSSREDASNPPQLAITTAPRPVTTTLGPTADTYVYQGAPTTTYGLITPLLSSAAAYRILLRFDTSWIQSSASISSVTLRLYATVGLPSGGIQVHPEADAWTESGTSWSNQPAWNSQVLATSGTQSAPGWISITFPPSAITPGENTDLGLGYSVSQLIERVASREDTSRAPQLVITTS
jgi:hypothetical protein